MKFHLGKMRAIIHLPEFEIPFFSTWNSKQIIFGLPLRYKFVDSAKVSIFSNNEGHE